ncbi:MAG TPA: ASKHA domain-containing protein [Methylomirabilota bacterium]|nr:ASKHA domain-containing protein [Methylomirabilota bacterium]
MSTVPVTFLPEGRIVEVPAGTRLLPAAQTQGVELTATCGGRGRCTSCRVRFVEGPVPPPGIGDRLQLGEDLVREGYRLACQTLVVERATVQVAPPLDEGAFQILGAPAGAADAARGPRDSGVRKVCVRVELPREEGDPTSDVEALCRAAELAVESVPIELMRGLPAVLRETKGEVTVASFHGQLLAVERGDTAGLAFGLAIDVGTTSVVTNLLELASGEVLGSVSSLNPQATFGGDLMSRFAFAQASPANLRKLTARIVGLLNQHVEEVLRQAGVLPQWVYKVTVVGNTGMHHLLLGIDPTYVGLAPYTAVVRQALVLPARTLPLRINPEARVCFLPLVAGFVGADAVAAALATGLDEARGFRAVVDIGTNGEVVMGTPARLLACSAPAGPALEGAQIRHGMRAATGAIDRVACDGADLVFHVLGEGPPQGICGSGLLDLLAVAIDAGLIDATGLIQVEARQRLPASLASRLAMRGEERLVILVPRGGASDGGEIVLTQEDVRQLQLAKGAIAGGIRTLQRILGVPDAGLTELMLAGGFGNYLSVPSAVRIGLIPPLPPGRIRYVGNAAALGAQLALLSEAERARADRLARTIEHVPLATHPDFQDLFVEAMNFPPSGGSAETPPTG